MSLEKASLERTFHNDSRDDRQREKTAIQLKSDAPAPSFGLADSALSIAASSQKLAALDNALIQFRKVVNARPRSGLNASSPKPVQLRGAGTDTIHSAAVYGMSGSGGGLPHLEKIQAAFGHHDVRNVRAHVGGRAAEATQAMGALAYASDGQVAFGQAPDLFTAAHEAAHVVQQRGGVQLKGGVGQVGDRYEEHADAVAHKVVRGESAQELLDTMAGVAGPTALTAVGAVQRKSSIKISIKHMRIRFLALLARYKGRKDYNTNRQKYIDAAKADLKGIMRGGYPGDSAWAIPSAAWHGADNPAPLPYDKVDPKDLPEGGVCDGTSREDNNGDSKNKKANAKAVAKHNDPNLVEVGPGEYVTKAKWKQIYVKTVVPTLKSVENKGKLFTDQCYALDATNKANWLVAGNVHFFAGIKTNRPAQLAAAFHPRFNIHTTDVTNDGKSGRGRLCLYNLRMAAALVDKAHATLAKYRAAVETGAGNTEKGIAAAALVATALATSGLSLGVGAKVAVGGAQAAAAEGATIAAEAADPKRKVSVQSVKQAVVNVLAKVISAGVGGKIEGATKDLSGKVGAILAKYAAPVVESCSEELIKLAGEVKSFDEWAQKAPGVLAAAAAKAVVSTKAGKAAGKAQAASGGGKRAIDLAEKVVEGGVGNQMPDGRPKK